MPECFSGRTFERRWKKQIDLGRILIDRNI